MGEGVVWPRLPVGMMWYIVMRRTRSVCAISLAVCLAIANKLCKQCNRGYVIPIECGANEKKGIVGWDEMRKMKQGQIEDRRVET